MLYSMMKKLPLREMALGSGLLNIILGTASLALARPLVDRAYVFLEGHPPGEAVELVKSLIKIYIAAGMLMIGLAMLATATTALGRRRVRKSSTPEGAGVIGEGDEFEALRGDVRKVAARHDAIELRVVETEPRGRGPKSLEICAETSGDCSLKEVKTLIDDLREVTRRPILVRTSQGLIVQSSESRD